jgi:alpha-tubulin suppressor-like RCC1 family protein/tRNA A-37 threonylcarbamoyl transferase component Bud32
MALPQLLQGMVFARDFRVVKHLSAGGMGAVYVVEQISTQRLRALKIMLPELVREPRARERFMQEATVSARIRSDHVVEVVGAGIDDETGTPWMAMELLEGEELADTMKRRGVLAPVEVMEIYRQLCHGLGLAHRAGLVHRDMKPENIFMANARREGVSFTVKILDFGIAKVVGESRTSAQSTSAIGSPLWMAPEQAEGHGIIRPATDVWALGLIAYYLLTGKYYWHAANREDFIFAALLKEVYMDALETASVRAHQYGVAARIPPGFDGWFFRCAHRDVSQRFGDANEALAALMPVLGAVAGVVPNAATYPGPMPGVVNAAPAYPVTHSAMVGTPVGFPALPTPSAPVGYGTQAWTPGPVPPSFANANGPIQQAPTRSSGVLFAVIAMTGFFVLLGGVAAWMFVGNRTTTTTGNPTATGGLPSLVPRVFRGPQCRGTGTQTDVPGIAGATSVAAGRYHSCAALTDGTARCWGWNQLGQLGDNSNEDQYVPVVVAGVTGVTQIAAGQGLSCALQSNGAVMCWGLTPMGIRRQAYVVNNITAATQIAVGESHACARRADGKLFCWGGNDQGQLGNGTTQGQVHAIEVPSLGGVVQVAAGAGHTCALFNDATVWCWGRQEQGQLGNGRRSRDPNARPGMVSGLSNVVQIAAGENHTCALLREGTLRCWGWNEMNQLGIGTDGNQVVPMAVQDLTDAVRVSAGLHHTCALQRTGALWCWGENYTCQLGAGGIQGPSRPMRIEAPGVVTEVSGGANHTCVRTPQGNVRCWGFNIYGQIGNGTSSRQPDLDTVATQ